MPACPGTTLAATRDTAGSATWVADREPEPGQLQSSGDDGIAIVGMACRFPGAQDLQSFWGLLEDGLADAVTDGRRDSGSWQGVAGDPAQSDDDALRRARFHRRDRPV